METAHQPPATPYADLKAGHIECRSLTVRSSGSASSISMIANKQITGCYLSTGRNYESIGVYVDHANGDNLTFVLWPNGRHRWPSFAICQESSGDVRFQIARGESVNDVQNLALGDFLGLLTSMATKVPV